MTMRWVLTGWLLLFVALPAAGQEEPAPPPQNTCRACHAVLEGSLGKPAQLYADDIHQARNLTCASCHGGDPTEADPTVSMDPAKGFIGTPQRTEIPRLCARCHSDASFMRNYNPRLRTDQLAQYRTSVHGQRLQRGDAKVAVCTDCHSVHDMRPASSPLSAVYPLRLPETCAACHSDAEHMKPYDIPTDQLASYQASVHYATLEAGDLSAPTCATCHGNHGAAPPGVASVERVCGTCHVFQEQLFEKSPHKEPWASMGLSTCITCHGNHRIEPTGDHRIGTGEQSFCVTCHVEGDPGWSEAEEMHTALTELDTSLQEAAAILDRAERAGMDVSEARLTQANAHENLVKARVDVHAFRAERVVETTKAGMELAQQVQEAGKAALHELSIRRQGLGLSLLAIAFVVLSLWLLIRYLERRGPPVQQG